MVIKLSWGEKGEALSESCEPGTPVGRRRKRRMFTEFQARGLTWVELTGGVRFNRDGGTVRRALGGEKTTWG